MYGYVGYASFFSLCGLELLTPQKRFAVGVRPARLFPRVLRMPRYYFRDRRGQVTFRDNEGVELTDLREAAIEGVRRGREIALYRSRHNAIYAEGKTMPHRNVFTEIHRPNL